MVATDDKYEDLALIKEALNGKKEAFGKLIEKYQTPIYNLAFRMMGNHEEAYDVTQDSFLRAYKALKSFRIEYSFFTWLYTISLNVCRNNLKRKKIICFFSINSPPKNADDNITSMDLADNRMNPEILYEEKRKREVIQSAIMKLPDKYKSIIVERYIEGLSYEEIAKIEKLPLGTVKTQIHRARKILVGYLKKTNKMIRN
ncbi:MAG: sigma-70 family RNA polymerase sigma factor [Candidatus Firestonebacteria bacterium]|nr:sigma-70 family RNA polymerase sigma factor [Candidatus Firestonebacteria bacterium]